MTTLYVCVDESGNRRQHSHYVVAGAWFVSDRDDPSNVLDGTKDRLLAQCVAPAGASSRAAELRGASLHPDTVDDAVEYLQQAVHDDGSIRSTRLPWELSVPVVFTASPMQSDVFLAALEGQVGRLDAFEVMQVAATSTVLSPLFQPRQLLDGDGFDDVRVLLDAATWKNTAETVREGSHRSDIGFEIHDSKRTPGIQLADLAAYAWFQRLQRGNCQRATGLLHQRRLTR